MRAGWLALVLLLAAQAAAAQTMRPFSTFRQLHAQTRLQARLEYGAGVIRVGPGRTAELYRMDLLYDGDRFVPVSDYNAARGQVVLGLRPQGAGGLRVMSRRQLEQVAAVTFSPDADLSLDLMLGAVDADLELGGLRVSELRMKAGASRAVLRFSESNGTRCRRAEFSAGAAELAVLGLGNSRCDEIRFEGGIGKVTLDFSGAWTSSSRVELRMAIGELTLRLPRGVGVRLAMDKFLSSFEPGGLVRREGAFVSPDYDRAGRRLDIDLATAVGGVNVEWVGEKRER